MAQYENERNEAMMHFFNALTSFIKKAEKLLDMVIEQEQNGPDDRDNPRTRRRPGSR